MHPREFLPPEVEAAVRAVLHLGRGEALSSRRLSGGVSSDVWLVESGAGQFCVKRAIPQLRVEQQWLAPVSRNATEVAWLQLANTLVPGHVPRVLGHDPAAGVFVMPYLPPDAYPLWKSMLRDGDARVQDAGAVGSLLLQLHAATAGDPRVADAFDHEPAFHALRMDPFFATSAARHPAHAEPLHRLIAQCSLNRRVLIHGDFSPKNILVGPAGPVVLDAEVACYGDPAFDLAFCLHHLMLKCIWKPDACVALKACFESVRAAYLGGVQWEDPGGLERRASALLPGLLLARVDGKSPVEYLDDAQRARVRGRALAMIGIQCSTLSVQLDRWLD